MRLTKKIALFIAIIITTLLINMNAVNATTLEVTTETLNLRKEASTESNIVALISEGEECEVIGEEGDWYEVRYGEYTGYVSKEYVKVIGEESETSTEGNTTDNNSSNNTSENNNNSEENADSNNSEESNTNNEENSEEPTTGTTQTKQTITATTSAEVDVRITPLIQGNVIETIKNNTEVTVINQINGWAYIQTDTISGWAREDTLKINIVDDNNDNNNDNADNSDNSDKQDEENNTDTTTDNNSSEFAEKTMYTTDVVNIRKEPSTGSNIIMVVERNTALTVVGESGDWYEVETSQGNAYVSKELLSEEETSVTNRGNVDRTTNTQDKENEEKEAEVANTSTSNSSTSSTNAEEIVAYAKKFLGVPYVYGGASPSGFDCSGFTMYVFDHFGISMRHGAQAQAKLGETINVDESSKSSILNNLEIGDLVFFLDYETMDEIGHCGIYIGNGNFIHASSGSGYCVKINSLLPGEYYNTRFCAVRRVL